jgi:rhomboid protease GluP
MEGAELSIEAEELPDQTRDLRLKVRVLWVPFLVVAVGFLATYSAIHLVLAATSLASRFDWMIVEIWLPIAVVWVPIFFIMRPRIATLVLNRERNLPFLYLMISAAAVAVPTIVAQDYIGKMTGGVARVGDVRDIDDATRPRYVFSASRCLDLPGTRFLHFDNVGTRDGSREVLSLVVAVPFCGTGTESGLTPPAWLGLKRFKVIKSSLPEAEKEDARRALIREALEDPTFRNLTGFEYLERVRTAVDRQQFEEVLRDGYLPAVGVRATDGSAPKGPVLLPRSDSFEKRGDRSLAWIFGSFAIGAGGWFLLLLPPMISRARIRKLDDLDHAESLRSGRRGAVAWIRKFPALSLLISANFLVFLGIGLTGAGVVSVSAEDLVRWGANARPLLHGTGWGRLSTSTFVHSGLPHLAANLYGLLFAGLFLEPLVGGVALLAAYVICGTAGSLASAWLHPATVSVGASGAIFGLCGILLVLLIANDSRLAPVRRPLIKNIGLFVLLNLVIGALATNVDNAAHIGGLVAGAILGLAFHRSAK